MTQEEEDETYKQVNDIVLGYDIDRLYQEVQETIDKYAN